MMQLSSEMRWQRPYAVHDGKANALEDGYQVKEAG